jgi:Putative auto-transporter adhesin, head GIN domain
MRRLLALAPLVAVALAGCGAGPTVTQRRELPRFERLVIDDNMDVTVRSGARPAAVVRAGEKALDDVHTDVEDGALKVSGRGTAVVIGSDPVDDARITLTVPDLDVIKISGDSDADLRDLRGDVFEVDISGDGAVRASGDVRRLTVEISGSGSVEMPGLNAREARVEVSGSGDVRIGRTEKLDVEISGSGHVSYRGRPQLSQSISGSGQIESEGN